MRRLSIILVCCCMAARLAPARSEQGLGDGNLPDGSTIQVTRNDDPVPDGCLPGDCSLREAVIEANGDVALDTIQLPPGTFTLSLPDTGPNLALDGDLDVTEAVVITGAGAGATMIDGGGIDRVFQIMSSAGTVEIERVTIQNGDSSTGGAVLNEAELILRSCEITGNHADNSGGGVRNLLGGVLSISSCELTSNVASNPGGGGSGGALSNSGAVTIRNSLLDDNWAEHTGGAISTGDVNPPAQTLIETSTISNNTANTDMQWFGGGGIINFGQLTISSSSIIANSAANSDGGGLNNWSQATLVNVTLSGNSAASEGGAVRNTSGATQITASTMTENTAPDTGGAFSQVATAVYFSFSIVSNNSGGNCNLPSDEGFCDYPSIDSENTCGFCAQFVNTDPMLGPLADNGGPTRTHGVLAGSPAIDGANPSSPDSGCPYVATPPGALTVDQRRFPRPMDGDENGQALCDLGAMEFGTVELFSDGFESGDTSAWSNRSP